MTSLTLPTLTESSSVYTGEDVRIPRLSVPSIRVSYKGEDDPDKVAPKGQFVQFDPATKATTSLGKEVTVRIIHYRQSLQSYTDTESYFTPEVSMRTKVVPLFCRTTSADGSTATKFVAKGTFKDLKAQFPQLSTQRIAYVLHDGALKSLVIKGATFSSFIDLQKTLSGVSTTSVMLTLTTSKEKKGTVIYYPIAFTIAEQAGEDPAIAELSAWFEKYDSLIARQQADRAEQAAIERGDGQTEPRGFVKAGDVATVPAAPSAEEIATEIDLEERAPIDEKSLPF